MGWVANFVDSLMASQGNILPDIAEEKKKAGYGRAARLIIDGPGGGVFDLAFTPQGLRPKPADLQIKNTIYLTEDTLLDLVTPNIDLHALVELIESQGFDQSMAKLLPRLDFRTAYANGLIRVGGDKSSVDAEEWSQLLDRVLLKVAFPIVVRGILRKVQRR